MNRTKNLATRNRTGMGCRHYWWRSFRIGIAVDSANRGHKTLLLEKYDFAKGTSSRSTKLVHGGVRYLQNGDISLSN